MRFQINTLIVFDSEFHTGTTFGMARSSPNFKHDYIRTPLGGFVNHSDKPNCELVDDEENTDYKRIKTIHKIQQGNELTLKYSLYEMCDYL